MNTPAQPPRGPATFEAGTLHVERLPDESLALLSRVELQVLRDGEVNEAKAGRDLCLGVLASAAIGLIGMISTIDWDAAFLGRRPAPFIWAAILLAIIAAFGLGAAIYHSRYERTLHHSAYADLMKRLEEHFKKHNPPVEP
jgi:hypothetical protein